MDIYYDHKNRTVMCDKKYDRKSSKYTIVATGEANASGRIYMVVPNSMATSKKSIVKTPIGDISLM